MPTTVIMLYELHGQEDFLNPRLKEVLDDDLHNQVIIITAADPARHLFYKGPAPLIQLFIAEEHAHLSGMIIRTCHDTLGLNGIRAPIQVIDCRSA